MPHRPYALGLRPRASHPPAPHHCHAAAIRYRAAALTAGDAWVPSSPMMSLAIVGPQPLPGGVHPIGEVRFRDVHQLRSLAFAPQQ